MDSRFLQSFIAVVDCGSMADAARRLDLPPTTVAQQMRALEADVVVINHHLMFAD
ncbi:MAG TPA: hypothetical protein DDZ62_00775, partial [Delftia acidovorans]|nr:hypothetical protein [Delftia acidovorans]